MTVGTFEPQATGWLTGTISAEVLDPDGVEPSTIIRVSDPWKVQVQWSMKGTYAALLHNPLLKNMWHVRVFAESLGPNQEIEITHMDVELKAGDPYPNSEFRYDKKLDVPAGLLDAGPYRLVTVVTADDGAVPAIPYRIAAFCEGPIVQLYEAP